MYANDFNVKETKYLTLFKGAQKASKAKDKCHRPSKLYMKE